MKKNPVLSDREITAAFVESLEDADMGEFDRITQLGAHALRVPVCLVSLVEEHRQFFAGEAGLPTPYCDVRETPLSHSFCKTVVRSRRVVIVTNALEDDRFSKNPAISDLGVMSYLGFPLTDTLGNVLGAFCFIDTAPHSWSAKEINLARDFAAVAASQVQSLLEKYHKQSMFDVLMHDLNNPLSAADFSARYLLEEKSSIPKKVQPLVESILSSTTQALELIKNAKTWEKKLEAQEYFRFDVLLSEVLENLEVTASQKSIEFKTKLSEEGPLMVSDGWLVQRILENLVDNAIKYSPRDSEIHFESAEKNELIGLRIRDSGPGFSEEDQAKLYKRYSQLSARPTEGEHSSGLGLSIAKRLVMLTGGSLELVSQPGESAEFEVLFPRY